MRRFFRIVGLAALCIIGSLAIVVAVAYSMGTVTVSVHEKKPNGALGMRLAPAEDLADATAEVRPWLPAIKLASEELARCPDTTLVEVISPAEKVAIRKNGDSIVIETDSLEERVRVSVPLGAAYLAASQLESLDEKAVTGD